MATTGLAWTGYLGKREETKSRPSGHLWPHRKATRGVPWEHRAWSRRCPQGGGTRWSVRSLPSQTTPWYCECELFHLEKENANTVLMAPGYSGKAGPAPKKGRTNTGCRQQSWQGAFSEAYPQNPNFTQSHGLAPCWTSTPRAQPRTAESTWTSHLKDPHLQDHFSPKVFLPLTLHHLCQLLTLTAWLDSLTGQKNLPPKQRSLPGREFSSREGQASSSTKGRESCAAVETQISLSWGRLAEQLNHLVQFH